MTPRSPGGWAALLVAGLLVPAGAGAQVALRVVRLDDAALRVDGDLRDWDRLRIRRLPVGTPDDGDGSFRHGLAHDDRGLYLAASVRDPRRVSGPPTSRRQDALVWSFAPPAGDPRELWIFPGVPGERASAARMASPGGRLAPAAGVRVVEGPRRDGEPGVAVEVFVPFAIVPGGDRWSEGRLAVRYQDVDREARPDVRAVIASVADLDRPTTWPPLRVAGTPSAVLRGFLAARGLEAAPHRFDLRGDVTGDGAPERVVIVDRFVVVFGSHYREGRGFDFLALPVRGGQDVAEARLEDLTGDDVAELVLVYRVRDDGVVSDVWRVLDPEPGRIRPLLGVETSRRWGRRALSAPVRVQRSRTGAPGLEIRAASADDIPPDEIPTPRLEPGIRPLLVLPLATVKKRTLRFQEGAFAVVAEEPAPASAPPAPRAASSPPPPPAPAPAPAARFDRDAILALARRRLALPAGTPPRHRVRGNVAGDGQPEEAVVLGTHLVVLGPGFREGRGFFAFPLPAEGGPDDVLGLETADLTGDGVDELLIRVRRRAGDITRQVLLVHRIGDQDGGDFPRLAAIEVRRARGDAWVENRVRVQGRGRRARLVVQPGRARGWDERSWPWAPEAPEATPTPVLLPWRDRPVRYRWDGGRLVAPQR